MDSSIHSLPEGATRANGVVAVIDVFAPLRRLRSLSPAGPSYHHVARRPSLSAMRVWDESVSYGEVRGRPPEQFSFGNSPFEIDEVDFTGKTIIQRTSAGTQGVVAAVRANSAHIVLGE